jgi:hypothetical protein
MHEAHYVCAKNLEGLNLKFGLPTVILSTIVGTSVFASLDSSTDNWIKLGLGLLSITSAVLASLQTFLGYAARAEKHKTAAVKYGALRREIKEVLDFCSESEPVTKEFMNNLRKRWDAIDSETPTVPEKVYRKAIAEVVRRHEKTDTTLEK